MENKDYRSLPQIIATSNCLRRYLRGNRESSPSQFEQKFPMSLNSTHSNGNVPSLIPLNSSRRNRSMIQQKNLRENDKWHYRAKSYGDHVIRLGDNMENFQNLLSNQSLDSTIAINESILQSSRMKPRRMMNYQTNNHSSSNDNSNKPLIITTTRTTTATTTAKPSSLSSLSSTDTTTLPKEKPSNHSPLIVSRSHSTNKNILNDNRIIGKILRFYKNKDNISNIPSIIDNDRRMKSDLMESFSDWEKSQNGHDRTKSNGRADEIESKKENHQFVTNDIEDVDRRKTNDVDEKLDYPSNNSNHERNGNDDYNENDEDYYDNEDDEDEIEKLLNDESFEWDSDLSEDEMNDDYENRSTIYSNILAPSTKYLMATQTYDTHETTDTERYLIQNVLMETPSINSENMNKSNESISMNCITKINKNMVQLNELEAALITKRQYLENLLRCLNSTLPPHSNRNQSDRCCYGAATTNEENSNQKPSQKLQIPKTTQSLILSDEQFVYDNLRQQQKEQQQAIYQFKLLHLMNDGDKGMTNEFNVFVLLFFFVNCS
ncbi:hypothetical protein SNEBB_011143 [Seison nebaliae]|nr:hypothetical protein SNEBB_011143 [Seison nebaliae]